MARTCARLRRSVFGTRPVLWTGGALAWALAAGASPLFDRPLVLLVVAATAFAVYTLPTMKPYMAAPWTVLDTLSLSGIGGLLPLLVEPWLGPFDQPTLVFFCAMAAIFFPGVLAMLWPLPRVSPERLRRDVEEAVVHAIADGRLEHRGHPIVRVVIDPSVCHGMDGPLDVQGPMGRRRVSLENHLVRLHAFPLLVVHGEARALSRADGLPLDLLAPYGLPVSLPKATWQAFPDLVVWEAPTSAHQKLALAGRVERARQAIKATAQQVDTPAK